MSGSEHICKLADFLRIGYRLIERLAEIMRAKNCKVGVVALELLERMAVNHRKVVVVILLADKAARILAEGSDLVFERLRISDKL